MASTEFQVVSWQPRDPVTNDKLDAMVDNDNYLRDWKLQGRYAANGVTRETGLRMASGLALIPASGNGKSADRQVSVSFNSYFSESCIPIVTTGIVSGSQRQLFVTIDGPGSTLQPTRDGFQVHAHVISSSNSKKFTKNFYVSWHAIGY